MTLSNTAVPQYYALFRDQVLAGKIPVCEEIALEMERIDELVANPNYYYDDEAIDGFIRFCESEMTLTDGSELRLLDSFKLWAESVLGWYYFETAAIWEPGSDQEPGRFVRREVKKRLVRKQYLIVARGSAKSLYMTLFQAYFLTIDPSTTDQVTTAPTMKQAEEVMTPFSTAILRAPGPLFKFLTWGNIMNTSGNPFQRQKLASTKKGIENFLTGSKLEIRPMSIDKLQGLRCKLATVDEWLSGDIRADVVGALEQGASKVDGYLIIAVSSEGTVRNGAGDSMKMELAKILRGEYHAPHISIWHYKLDDVSEVGDPSKWVKANPNLGITVSYETYQLDVERAEQSPAVRNDILAKRFGIPSEGYTFFFTYEETLPVNRVTSYWQMPCALGIDLSQGDDFCAFTFLFPLNNGGFGVKTRSYITEVTLHQLPPAMREKYNEFIDEGTLIIMTTPTLDLDDVYEDVTEHIRLKQYDVRAVGYDPYNAKSFMESWVRDNGPFGVEKVIQGSRTESVPLGEIKTLVNQGLLIFDESLMSFCMGNAITIEDTNGNRKLLKRRREEKIDNVSALMDARVAYNRNTESFE